MSKQSNENNKQSTVNVPRGLYKVAYSNLCDGYSQFGTLHDIKGVMHTIVKSEYGVTYISVKVHKDIFIWMDKSILQLNNDQECTQCINNKYCSMRCHINNTKKQNDCCIITDKGITSLIY